MAAAESHFETVFARSGAWPGIELDPGESGCLAGCGEGDQFSYSASNIGYYPMLFRPELRRSLGKENFFRWLGADPRRLGPPDKEKRA